MIDFTIDLEFLLIHFELTWQIRIAHLKILNSGCNSVPISCTDGLDILKFF